jgi:hypothetical protein
MGEVRNAYNIFVRRDHLECLGIDRMKYKNGTEGHTVWVVFTRQSQ